MSRSLPTISFQICSWKAPESLEKTLSSIFEQEGNPDDFEVILVNNGFSPQRASQLLEKFPLIHLVEEKAPGLAFARRAGFRTVRGTFISCLDDDNTIAPGYLSSLLSFIERYPNLGCISPVVLPIWEAPVKNWVRKFGVYCLSYNTLAAPTNPEERVWVNPDFKDWPWPPGGGMILHRSVVEDYLLNVNDGRRLALGRVGASLGGSEDQDIYGRFVRLGKDAGYSQKILVYHDIPKQRTEWSYLVRLNFRMTQDWALMESFWRSEKNPLGQSTLGWHLKQIIRLFGRWVFRRIPLQYLILGLIRHAGYFWGWLRIRLRLGAG